MSSEITHTDRTLSDDSLEIGDDELQVDDQTQLLEQEIQRLKIRSSAERMDLPSSIIPALRFWNAWAMFLQLALCIGSIAWAATANEPMLKVTVSAILYDKDQPKATRPTPHDIGEAQIFWMMPVFSLISAIGHFIHWKPMPDTVITKELRDGTHFFLWVEYGFSAGVMTVAISFLVGLADLYVVMLLFVVNIATMFFGYATEVAVSHPQKMIMFFVGTLMQLITWTVLGAVFFSGYDRAPEFVTALFLVMGAGYALYGCVMYWHQFGCICTNPKLNRTPENWTSKRISSDQQSEKTWYRDMLYRNARYTKVYIALSFIVKTLLVMIVSIGSARERDVE